MFQRLWKQKEHDERRDGRAEDESRTDHHPYRVWRHERMGVRRMRVERIIIHTVSGGPSEDEMLRRKWNSTACWIEGVD
jgi:hypothetical protein